MTYLQMLCFISLAKTQKMSETASALGLNLSTLSKNIDKLESEFSAKLFEKKHSLRRMTAQGELIYPSVKYIVKQYDDMRKEMFKYSSAYESSINVAIGFQQSHIIRQLTVFMKQHPNIKFEVTEGSAGEVLSMLDSGVVDLGIVYEQVISSKKYPTSYPLMRDRLCAIVSENHPLAGRGVVSVSELSSEKFFLYRGDYLMYRYLLNVCIAAGFVPNVEHNTMRMSTLLLNVQAGNGVSFLSESTADMHTIGGNVVLHLTENPMLTLLAVSATEFPDKSLDKLLKFLVAEGQCGI